MKRLDVNIERVKIKGKPHLLLDPVKKIDERMQNLADYTQIVKGLLCKYNDSNAGKQYDKIRDSIKDFSRELYDASESLNNLQRQLVNFINKILIYEEYSNLCARPNSHNVRIVDVDVNTSEFYFQRDDIIKMIRRLEGYLNTARNECRELKRNRNDIGGFWCDPQFDAFSEWIDGVCLEVENGCKDLEHYVDHLKIRLKEFE